MKSLKFLLLLVPFLSFGLELAGQKPRLKSVDYRNFEKQTTDMSLHARVFTLYDRDGNVISQENFARNKSGDLIKLKQVKNSSNARGSYQTIINYDSLGHITQEEFHVSNLQGVKERTHFTIFNRDGSARRFVSIYNYNKAGKITGISSFDIDNNLIGKESRKYRDSGEEYLIKSWTYLDGARTTKQTYQKLTEFDEKGNLKKQVIDKMEAGPNTRKSYREEIYFDRNQTVKWLKFTDGVLTSQFVRGGSEPGPGPSSGELDFGTWATNTDYDSLGNKIKTTFTEIDPETGDEIITQVNEFAYDDRGNLTKTLKIFFEPEGERTEEERTEYDQFSNVTRFSTFVNGVLISENVYDYEFHF